MLSSVCTGDASTPSFPSALFNPGVPFWWCAFPHTLLTAYCVFLFLPPLEVKGPHLLGSLMCLQESMGYGGPQILLE